MTSQPLAELTMTEQITEAKAELHGKFYFKPIQNTAVDVKHKYWSFNGTGEFSPQLAAMEIARQTIFRRHYTTGDLYAFNPNRGIYEPAETIIDTWVSQNLCELATTSKSTELHNELKRTALTATKPDARYIQLQNGLFDLFTGTLQPNNPGMFFTRQFPFAFDPTATPTTFIKFLSECQPEAKHQKQLLEFIGYCLYYERPIQKSNIILYGVGSNGKSTFLNVIKAFLGLENISSLTLQRLESSPFATSGLLDKYANIQADLPDERLNSTSTFKQITGGDAVTVERKGKDSYSAVLPAKFIMSANNPPEVPDHEPALFRRLMLIEFAQNFEGRENTKLEAQLTTPTELSGLFNLVHPLLRDLLDRGAFSYAPDTKETREIYLNLSRPLYRFIKEMVKYPADTDYPTPKADYFNAYCAWAKQNNKPQYNFQDFCKRFFNEPEIAGLVRITKMPMGDDKQGMPAYAGVELLNTPLLSKQPQNTPVQENPFFDPKN